MKYNFSETTTRKNSFIRLENNELPQKGHFKYLGSMLNAYGDIDEVVKHRIAVGWPKWRASFRVLCDKQVIMKLKCKFYRTTLLPALLYGTECWATKPMHIDKIGVAEMHMFTWMCEKPLQTKFPTTLYVHK